ncbi:TraR/DksA family transcriptional regulator [Campylobacter hyointestinalis]|uniref:Molecular chaperone DnaK suppressor DksA n=1 Tax=Campylobacter hyointestinalis subsp. hyointestinalis TaxID=91352 RepID=A0A2S5J4Y2_CAMHY|nr:RNA polymerase-binding protein DksA [Campylobacter hyointestinalis]ANE31934.1 DnaK suppressor protein [Campylobacter hyointestinalis subsp. hyointestinalis LMG 9260]KEA44549.1 molecular chaperone DnaK [Campylobacter hyointestinalis subsp. hyointestinalis]MBT0612247.1 RNA polymerase-binding protein DksA [Campylobacter hyointestinalis subsp. hyointestinalis]MDL2347135.1 RNA polymerase-binding protein DksA [Campylobacter hyointestinalis]MDL2348877.1 RNA polymerase-binding protein DksA [Campylo
MTNSDLEYFKKLLEERKLQIKKNILDATDEINGLRDSGASDEFDFANISADSILEQSISSKQKQELNEIGVALTKIANKTYGICEMCEDDIDIERLKVNPHARHCISCRELIEKNNKNKDLR